MEINFMNRMHCTNDVKCIKETLKRAVFVTTISLSLSACFLFLPLTPGLPNDSFILATTASDVREGSLRSLLNLFLIAFRHED